MISLKTIVSERRATTRVFRRSRCADRDRTVNDRTGTVFEHSLFELRVWLSPSTPGSGVTRVCDNSALSSMSHNRRCIGAFDGFSERWTRLDHNSKPRPKSTNAIRKPDSKGGSETSGRALAVSTRGRGTHGDDTPPVFILTERGSGNRYVIAAKPAGESTIQFLLTGRQLESLPVYYDGFWAHEPLNEKDAFDPEYVVHGEGEYADRDVHSTPAGVTGRCCDRGSRHAEASPKTSLHRIAAHSNFAVESIENRGAKHTKPSSKLRRDPPILYVTRANAVYR